MQNPVAVEDQQQRCEARHQRAVEARQHKLIQQQDREDASQRKRKPGSQGGRAEQFKADAFNEKLSPGLPAPSAIRFQIAALDVVIDRRFGIAGALPDGGSVFHYHLVDGDQVNAVVGQRPSVAHQALRQHGGLSLVLPEIFGAQPPEHQQRGHTGEERGSQKFPVAKVGRLIHRASRQETSKPVSIRKPTLRARQSLVFPPLLRPTRR